MNDIEDGRLRAHADDELDPVARAEVAALLVRSPAARAHANAVIGLGHEADRALSLTIAPADPAAAWERLGQTTASRSHWGWPWAVAIAAAILLTISWVGGRGTVVEGSRVVTQRETIALGRRAVVVADEGAQLSWSVQHDGRTGVTQRAGAVFYRVNAGAAFTVDTPAGRVTVTGTCFTVELRSMRRTVSHLGSAAAGAGLATVLFLTVHEGSVSLANEGDAVAVGAGQRARAGGGQPARLETDADHDPDTAAAQTIARLRADNQALRAEVRGARGDADTSPEPPAADDDDAADPMVAVRRCANSMGMEGCSTFEPDAEVLEERARCGTLGFDAPGFLNREGYAIGRGLAELVDLSDDERSTIRQVNERFATDYAAQLEAIIDEQGLAQGKAVRDRLGDDTPPWAAIRAYSSVIEGSTSEVAADVRTTIARQLAGLEPRPASPSDLPPLHRYYHLQADLGGAYERALAERIGADRARELRVAEDGWGSKTLYGGECPEDREHP
ncbi:MAG: FecR domain-containing protein [Deltaproteobacteria bacterium]|nr:FecR domain-containing protein [Deltaproteobacteria bacterium]